MSMELFVEAGHPHTFLLELIVAYLKLADRGKVKIVHLSQVNNSSPREHLRP